MPTGVLAFATPYSWSVSYKDSKGAQGPASTPTSFTTQPAPNRPPQAPTNLSPPDGSANQPLTLTLQASAFSDPDGDSHASSQWLIKRSSDNTTVLDSGADTANKTIFFLMIGRPPRSTLFPCTALFRSSKGAQGPASTPTTFTTGALPPLKLIPALASGTGLFQLQIGSEDGSPLDPNRAINIAVFATTDLTLGLRGWIRIADPITLTNGRLYLDDPQNPTAAQRFFRVEESP